MICASLRRNSRSSKLPAQAELEHSIILCPANDASADDVDTSSPADLSSDDSQIECLKAVLHAGKLGQTEASR
jgi:hypothetical protein